MSSAAQQDISEWSEFHIAVAQCRRDVVVLFPFLARRGLVKAEFVNITVFDYVYSRWSPSSEPTQSKHMRVHTLILIVVSRATFNVLAYTGLTLAIVLGK